jgi:hypothetical protein
VGAKQITGNEEEEAEDGSPEKMIVKTAIANIECSKHGNGLWREEKTAE